MSKARNKWKKKLKRSHGENASRQREAERGEDRAPDALAVDPDAERAVRRAFLPCLGIFAVVLAVYVWTLYPSVAGGDSGELIVAAYRLGVAHPPGYPLFTLLGKLSTYLPLGSVAWRVNLLSAVFGALAAAVLARAVWKLTGSFAAGLFSGGTFAFSPLIWRWSITAEVFSLNDLFLATLISMLVSYEQRRSDRLMLGWFFVFGLGLSNHHTLVLFGAPMALWMVYRFSAEGFDARRVAAIVGSFAAGLLPYAYLFVSSGGSSQTTWRSISSASDFVAHVTRRQYGTFQLAATDAHSDLFEGLYRFFAQLPGETLYVGALLVLLGLVLPARKTSPLEGAATSSMWVVAVATSVYLVVFHGMSNLPLDDPITYDVHSRFWQAPNLVAFLFAGVGFWWLFDRKFGVPRMALIAIAVAAVTAQAGLHFAAENQRGNRLVAELARKTLERSPRNALLVSKGDLFWNGLRYMQVCEGVRPDVRLVDVEIFKAPWMGALLARRFDDVRLPGEFYRSPAKSRPGSYGLGQLFDANVDRFDLFSNALGHDGDTSWQAGYSRWPSGPFDRMVARGNVFDIGAWLSDAEVWVEDDDLARPANTRDGSWEQIAWNQYRSARTRPGTHLLNYFLTHPIDRKYLRSAGEILERGVERDEVASAAEYLNLGIYYYLRRDEDPEAVAKLTRAWTRYLEVAPPDAAQVVLVRRVLQDPANARINLGGS